MGDTAAVVAGELGVGAAGPERAHRLVAAIATVIVVVTAVVVRHTAAVATGEHSGVAGVERCGPIRRQGEDEDTHQGYFCKGVGIHCPTFTTWILGLPDRAINAAICGAACEV